MILKLNRSTKLQTEIEKYLKSSDSTIWVAKTFGSFDYIIYVLSKDLQDFHDFFNQIKLRCSDGIKSYELLFAYHQYKYSFIAECVGEE